MDSDMTYYRKPERQMEWEPITIDSVIKPGWIVAVYSNLPDNHPVIVRLTDAGMGDSEIKNFSTSKIYDPQAICAKCGFDKIDDKFEPIGTRYEYWADGQGQFWDNKTYAAIKRTCLRCKYSWEVLPLT